METDDNILELNSERERAQKSQPLMPEWSFYFHNKHVVIAATKDQPGKVFITLRGETTMNYFSKPGCAQLFQCACTICGLAHHDMLKGSEVIHGPASFGRNKGIDVCVTREGDAHN